jgi:hypothetical protein
MSLARNEEKQPRLQVAGKMLLLIEALKHCLI